MNKRKIQWQIEVQINVSKAAAVLCNVSVIKIHSNCDFSHVVIPKISGERNIQQLLFSLQEKMERRPLLHDKIQGINGLKAKESFE